MLKLYFLLRFNCDYAVLIAWLGLSTKKQTKKSNLSKVCWLKCSRTLISCLAAVLFVEIRPLWLYVITLLLMHYCSYFNPVAQDKNLRDCEIINVARKKKKKPTTVPLHKFGFISVFALLWSFTSLGFKLLCNWNYVRSVEGKCPFGGPAHNSWTSETWQGAPIRWGHKPKRVRRMSLFVPMENFNLKTIN